MAKPSKKQRWIGCTAPLVRAFGIIIPVKILWAIRGYRLGAEANDLGNDGIDLAGSIFTLKIGGGASRKGGPDNGLIRRIDSGEIVGQ